MTTRLFAALIRHGDYQQRPNTPSAHQPFPLTETGRAQARAGAQAVAGFLKEFDCRLWPELDSSHMLRAWQTAQILDDTLGEQLGQANHIVGFDALAERGLGAAANLTVAEIEAVLAQDPRYPPPPPDWKANSHYRLPFQGAESLMGAGHRLAEHLTLRMSNLKECTGQSSLKLFVGHGAAMRHAAHHLGLLRFEQIATLSMYHCRPLFLEYRPAHGWSQVAGAWKVRQGHEQALD